jgi:hypothetical protein
MASKEEIKAEYVTHKSNGIYFVEDYRAQLGADVSNNVITENDAVEQYSALNIPLNFIKDGDWKNASSYLETMLSTVFCSIEIIKQMKSDVDTYITDNYSF